MTLDCKNTDPVKLQSGDTIKETKDFTYLGAVVSTEGGCDKDIDSRLSKAKVAFRKIKRIWGSKQYNRRTKIRLFNILIKPCQSCYMEVRHRRPMSKTTENWIPSNTSGLKEAWVYSGLT